MKRRALAFALSIAAAVLLAGCAASGKVDLPAPPHASNAGGQPAAKEPAEDLTRLSDQQLTARIAEQWRRLRDLTSQSLDLALNSEAANLAQDATYRRIQSDIAMHEQLLTQLEDEQRRRAAPPR